jgi:chromate transporter
MTDGTGGRQIGERDGRRVGLVTIARLWGRIGILGFGGPPTHIAMLRRLCVTDRKWLTAAEFEDGIAVTNLLPGPASTQLAIFCAWRLAGTLGGLVGGIAFIVPGLIAILALSALFFATHPPLWVLGAAAGAGAAVAAVALHAAAGLLPASWRRSGGQTGSRARWVAYVVAGGASAAVVGPWLVLVLVACGLAEAVIRSGRDPGVAASERCLLPGGGSRSGRRRARRTGMGGAQGRRALLRRGLRHRAAHAARCRPHLPLDDCRPVPRRRRPRPGHPGAGRPDGRRRGVRGVRACRGILAAVVAFSPSFLFVLLGGSHFDRIRSSVGAQAFLSGAGPAAIGAIAGSSIPLALALSRLWQVGVLALAAVSLLMFRRGVVPVLAGAGALGVVAALAGAPVPH